VLGFTLPAPQCGNGLCEQLSYCEPIRATGPVAFVNPFRFSTKYCDDKTGHYYYGHRYYNPTTGRWLSRDPLNESGGLHLYAFCGNDPVDFIDVLGLNGRAGSPGFHPISLSYWTLFFRGAPDWARPDGSHGWGEYPGRNQNNIGSQSNSNQMRDDEFAVFEESFIKQGLDAGCNTLHVTPEELAEAKKYMHEVLKAPAKGAFEAGTLFLGTGAVKAGGSAAKKSGWWQTLKNYFCRNKCALNVANAGLKLSDNVSQLFKGVKNDYFLGVVEGQNIKLFKAAQGQIEHHGQLLQQGMVQRGAQGFSVVVKDGQVVAIIRNSQLNDGMPDFNLPLNTAQQILDLLGFPNAQILGNK